MAKKDLWNNFDMDKSIAPQFINSNTTITGTGVDLRGYEGALVLIQSGAMAGSAAANVYTPEVQESDSSDTGFTAVADANLLPTTTPEASAAHNGGTDNTVTKIGYIGTKRYIRVVLTTTAFTTAGGYICANILKGRAHLASVGA